MFVYLDDFARIQSLLDFGNLQPRWWLIFERLQISPSGGQYGTAPRAQWAHVAYTWDGTTARHYINGTGVGSATDAPGAGGVGLVIGNESAQPYYTFFGPTFGAKSE